jgi:hypothetical protein
LVLVVLVETRLQEILLVELVVKVETQHLIVNLQQVVVRVEHLEVQVVDQGTKEQAEQETMVVILHQRVQMVDHLVAAVMLDQEAEAEVLVVQQVRLVVQELHQEAVGQEGQEHL